MRPDAPSAVGIIVPAHNEADHIAATTRSALGSLDHSIASGSASVDSTVVVVADACIDRTAALAREVLGSRGVVIEIDERCVGTARAVGSAVALDHLALPPSALWLANTDADSIVPTTWLCRQLALAAAGVECVAGIVGLANCTSRLHASFTSTYGLGIGPRRHRHVHGANLGIRGDLLLRLGNWASMVTGEDWDLWERAGAVGALRRSDPELVVLTSARTLGRAPAGFARDLRCLALDLDAAGSEGSLLR